jgi:SpoVK/Ycf46/Vps4 family AAA+-type ATPase
LDEIEKSLAGSTGPAGDGGVAADALGAVLSWMQEHQGTVFVIATANDVTGLPPELLRKGRFDELFFVDLPNKSEREEIVETALRQYKIAPGTVDPSFVARQTEGWTGAELSALVPEAMFTAFADGERFLCNNDIILAAKNVVPLSITAADKIAKTREWAKSRARPASTPQKQATAGTEPRRSLDIDDI